jgi:hypothetical protein
MPTPRSWSRRDQKAELLWKWLLRLGGFAAFVYVLTFMHGNVPVAAYVLIGGLIGLPNVISWQQVLNGKAEDEKG